VSRFASCAVGERKFAALVDGDVVRPLSGVAELGADTPSSVLCDPPIGDESLALGEVRLRPVVPRPGKIVCVGLNYHEHAEEGGYDLPAYPVLFTKFSEALVGAGEAVVLPPESSAADYEAVLAFVVGRPARRVGRDEALDVIAGYTIANDVTMRDYQYKTHQWVQGKSWEGSTPLGPFLVTADEVDPADLDIELTLNGETMQSANTSLLIFDVPRLVETISEFVTLLPGDVVLTGTPSGVGYRRDPKVLLRDGDEMAVSISGLGRLENRVVAEAV
jgi:acylpyruvate hydrolase